MSPPQHPAVLLAAVLLWCPGRLAAQDACVAESPEPEDLQITPTPGSPEDVTLDAPLVLRFAADVDVSSGDPAQMLTLQTADGVAVVGAYETFAAQPNVLVFRPSNGLLPTTDYVGEANDPMGFAPTPLSFTTGSRGDEIVPRFEPSPPGLSSRRLGGACAEYRIDVVFEPATDDGPRGSIEHLVYQTRGASLAAPVLRKRVRATMPSTLSASFLLTAAEAAEPICVQVVPVDGVGRTGVPLPAECFSPRDDASFVGLCSGSPVGTPRGRSLAGLVIGMGLGLLLWRREYRRRV